MAFDPKRSEVKRRSQANHKPNIQYGTDACPTAQARGTHRPKVSASTSLPPGSITNGPIILMVSRSEKVPVLVRLRTHFKALDRPRPRPVTIGHPFKTDGSSPW